MKMERERERERERDCYNTLLKKQWKQCVVFFFFFLLTMLQYPYLFKFSLFVL